MLNHSVTAVVARNEIWQGVCFCEPYEVSWAREAIYFVRALETARGPLPEARIQISPDGIRWIDEGARVALPQQADELTFCKLSHFGGWLRLAADLPEGSSLMVLIALSLKG